MYLTHPIRVIS